MAKGGSKFEEETATVEKRNPNARRGGRAAGHSRGKTFFFLRDLWRRVVEVSVLLSLCDT